MSKQFAFNSLPLVKKRRSAFDLSHSVKTTMNAGTLYPIYLQEVYPGDTFKDKTNIVARVSSAFLRPVVDNAFMDVYFFFVPNRLVFNKWSEVMGENSNGPWAQQASVSAPHYVYNQGISAAVYPGSVGDYLGLPLTSITSGGDTTTTDVQFDFNLLPFRAFALIWDEWFRDQNNIQPMNINKGGYSPYIPEAPNNNDWSPTNYMGKLPKVGKVHDYFTSCLPAPQKGGNVEFAGGDLSIPERLLPVSGLPLKSQGTGNTGTAPSLFPGTEKLTSLLHDQGLTLWNNVGVGKSILSLNPLTEVGDVGNTLTLSTVSYDSASHGALRGSNTSPGGNETGILGITNQFAYDKGISLDVGSVSINELRYAIALQRMLEKDALGGNRYTEYLLSHFGVLSPDARLQRSELLGGHRFPLSVQQVAQTSEPTQGNPLGSLGAYSLSNGGARFTKGFVEHGFVIGVACIRQYHTYQQGLERFWSRKNRVDYYDPVFAHIGEQPVYKRELFTTGQDQDSVFGYNEAWADLRYRPNRLTGQMRSDISNSLDIWHFADDYANAPTLNKNFIEETPAYIDRTLAVPSASQDQFLVDIYHQVRAYRCLPVYSTPSTLGV